MADLTYQPQGVYTKQGGLEMIVAADGQITVESGGVIMIGSEDITAALATPVAGVAAGYKVARGATALDGSNPTPVISGLATVVSVTGVIKTPTAPGVGTSIVTFDASTTGLAAGTFNMYAWKPTGTADAALIASTGTETVYWIAVGT